MKNTIALCIPAYNAAWCLPRLLKSAAEQVIPFDEVLVYNDCSTDNTEEVALKFGAEVINGKINVGCTIGKNELALSCKSGWIHFHDADDDLLPNFTTLAHKWMQKTDCPDVILFNYEYRNINNETLLSIRNFDKDALENNPLKYAILNQINPFCGLYNKQKFLKAGGFDTDSAVLYNEDSAGHIQLALNNLTFSAEQEISIINYYFEHSMSVANKKKCIEAQYNVLNKIYFKVNPSYQKFISEKAWGIAKVAASKLMWEVMDNCIKLARNNNVKILEGSQLFRFANVINPYAAFRLREALIRLFKPKLRRDV